MVAEVVDVNKQRSDCKRAALLGKIMLCRGTRSSASQTSEARATQVLSSKGPAATGPFHDSLRYPLMPIFLPDQYELSGYIRDMVGGRDLSEDMSGRWEGAMKGLNEEQRVLLSSKGLLLSFEKMTDDELMAIEDAFADEMQTNGLNDVGDGLNEYGELCRSTIVAMPD